MVTRRCREFKPTQVPGCFLWLRADYATVDGGGAVTGWQDLSRYGRSFTFYNTAMSKVSNAINGKPAILTEDDGYIASNANIDLSGTNEITIFAVFDANDSTSDKYLFQFGKELYDGEFGLRIYHDDLKALGDQEVYTEMKDWDGGVENYNSTHSDCFSQFYTWSFVYSRPGTSTDEGYSVRKDGYSETMTKYSGDGLTGNFGNTLLYLCAANAGTEHYFNGKIAEIIMFDNELSADNIKKIEHYLMARYQQYTWTPLDNPNITRWWDPTYGKTWGTGVVFWDDRRYGTRLTQSTADNQPTADPGNGRAALLFDGSNDALDGKTAFTWSAPRHLFLVCSIDTDVPGGGAATIIDGNAGQSNRIYVANANLIIALSNDPANGVNLAVTSDTWYVIDMVVLADSPYVKAALNGAAFTTNGTAYSNCSGIILGEYGGGGNNQKFICSDVICCNSELSSGERTQLINWLKTVNGIS